MENEKRMKLSEFLTEDYLTKCLKDGLDLVGIAERTKDINGGTCSTGTIHYWKKRHGLVPDTPQKRMKVGIKPEKLIEAYDLVDKTSKIEVYRRVTYTKKVFVKNIVVMISDLQIGACSTAQGYDPMPEKTINKYVDTFLENLIQMFATRELQIGTINLMLLGDIVDGELMFPKHKTINMGDQLKIAVKAMRRIIDTLCQFATGIVVHTVAGNHGRITHTHHKASNWDNVVYDTLEIVYEKDDFVVIDSNREFVKIAEIGDWYFLYTHGDVINGMITRQKAITKSNGFQRRMPHDAMLVGHFHTTMYMNYNRLPIVVNGCMYDSDLIQNELAGWECKRMIVFKVNEDRKDWNDSYPIDWLEMIDVE